MWGTAYECRSRKSSSRFDYDLRLFRRAQFFLLNSADITRPSLSEDSHNTDDDSAGFKRKHKELYDTLLKDFSGLPKASQNINHDNYGVVNVAPAVVPNPYLPSFRIFVYNITGTEYTPEDLDSSARLRSDDTESNRGGNHVSGLAASRCASPPDENTWRCRLNRPWHSNESAPSRTNRMWSPLGYAQVSVFRWFGIRL